MLSEADYLPRSDLAGKETGVVTNFQLASPEKDSKEIDASRCTTILDEMYSVQSNWNEYDGALMRGVVSGY